MIMINNLIKKYGRNLVLNNLNLKIEKGKTYGLVGENAAGKTTLINCITNIIKDYKGEIKYNFDQKLLGFMPQDAVLEEDLTPEKLLLFFSSLNNYNNKNVSWALKFAGCYDFRDKKIKNLSHGMRRKVMFAQAILNNPDLVILDEPTSGLDPKIIIGIRQLIKKLKNKGKTILISSHNTQDIEEICDRLLFLENGVLKQQKINDYRGSNMIKILLKSRSNNNLFDDIKKIKNVLKVKLDNMELIIFIRNEKLLNNTLKNIIGKNLDFVNIRVGREVDDIFK